MTTVNKFKSKYSIGVNSDIEEFKNTFEGKINDYTLIELEKLSDAHGSTMIGDYGSYKVYESDDYGREERQIMIVRAINESHAVLKASIETKNMEIATTGFYGACEIDIKLEIAQLKESIASFQRKLDNLEDLIK